MQSKNYKENEKTKQKTGNDSSNNLDAFLTLVSNYSTRILNLERCLTLR